MRIFKTRHLAAGKQWLNYRVRVTVEREGQRLTKREALTLVSGDTHELTFTFDPAEVATAE